MSVVTDTIPLLLFPNKDHQKQFWTPSLVGGKATNLFALEKLALPVPRWFCTTTAAFKKILSPIQETIDSLVQNSQASTATPESFTEVQNQITKLIQALPLPEEIEKELAQLSPETFWAVRSSASAEDSASHSFAGQFETFLYVPTSDVADKIRACLASAYNTRVLHYLKAQKERHEIAVAVVIQEMVNSQASGVMFTCDPRRGGSRASIVITAGYGLGEGIVGDKVETDTFLLKKPGLAIEERLIGEKREQVVFAVQEGQGTKIVPVSEERRSNPCVSDAELISLASWGLKLEQAFGAPQDIEWARDQSGKLFFTQTRPITTIAKSGVKKYIFDNSNIVESYPGVNTPLTLSVIRPIYEGVFAATLRRLGISAREIASRNHLFAHLLGYYRGRVFYNITHWYEMMRMFPFTEEYIRVWEKMLGVEDSDEGANSERGYVRKIARFLNGFIRFVYYFIFLDIYLPRFEKRLLKSFREFWDDEKRRAGFGNGYADPQDFEREWHKVTLRSGKDWELTLLNDAYAFIFSGLTQFLIKKFKFDNEGSQELFNELMCGVQGMDSVGPLESLHRLASHRKLKGEDAQYEQLFARHLELYGDRGMGELKLETLTLREAPELLRELVQTHQDRSEEPVQKMVKEPRLTELARRYPLKACLFKFVLKMAQRSILYREKFRLHRSRLFGMQRRAVRRMGAHLVSQNFITSVEDVFFLELTELFTLASGNAFSLQIDKLIEMRKAQYAHYKNIEVGPKYFYSHFTYTPITPMRENTLLLKGQGCSQGIVTAEAVVVTDISLFDEEKSMVSGKILVAPMTDPGWVFVMTRAAGLIVEKGSILSHTAIIGRELGIPTIVGVKNATSRIKSGDKLTMNASTGEIHQI